MDFLKSDLNHNTRKYNFVKNWRGGGGGETAGLPATPTLVFSQTVFFWSISLPDKDGTYPV